MMPDIFGGPTLEDLHEAWSKQGRHYAAAWQCGGCGTWYSHFVSSCGCQRRNMVTSGTSTNAAKHDPQNPPLTCEDVGCPCVKGGTE